MKVEVRNNSVHLDGYVNVHTRDSRELPSPRGRFVEQIMPKAFDQSLQKNGSVDLLFNHKQDRKLGSTTQGNLQLFEDSIGLRAICTVTDPEVVQKAKAGELRGWSFGFIATEQRWADGSNGVQRRFVDGLDLLEVSILDVTPAYYATTIEARGDEQVVIEKRSADPIEQEEGESPEVEAAETDVKDNLEKAMTALKAAMDAYEKEEQLEDADEAAEAAEEIQEGERSLGYSIEEYEMEVQLLKLKGRYTK